MKIFPEKNVRKLKSQNPERGQFDPIWTMFLWSLPLLIVYSIKLVFTKTNYFCVLQEDGGGSAPPPSGRISSVILWLAGCPTGRICSSSGCVRPASSSVEWDVLLMCWCSLIMKRFIWIEGNLIHLAMQAISASSLPCQRESCSFIWFF